MDDTLLQNRFLHPTVKTRLAPAERFALRKMLEERRSGGRKCTGWGLVRELLLAALDETDWPADRRLEEYAAYAVDCLRTGATNEFESE